MHKNSQKLMIRAWLCLGLFWIFSTLHAGDRQVTLAQRQPIHLGSQLPWQQWIDSTGQARVDQVAQRPASDFMVVNGPVSEGYTRKVVWLRMALPADLRAEPRLLLQISPPYLDRVTLYQQNFDGAWIASESGDLMPALERLPTRKFLFPLQPDAPILIRVESSSVMRMYASLWRPQALLGQIEREGWGLGLYFGLAMSLLLLVWGSAAVFKERRLAAIGTLGTLTLIHAFNLHGYTNIWLLGGHPALASALVGTGAFLVAAALAWLSAELLTRGQLGWHVLHRLFLALSALDLLALISVPLGYYPECALLGVVSPMLCVFAGTWVGGVELIKRGLNAERCLLFLAFGLHSVNSVLTLAEFTGSRVVKHDTAVFWQFHLLLLLTLAAAGIGAGLYQRFRQAHESRARAHQALTRSERLLESRVQERTQALDEAQQSLQVALDQERRMRLEQRQFFSMISHEFRTPLTIIDSAATEQMSFPDLSPEQPVERAAQIRRACRRLSTLVDNSLCSERFQVGGLQLVTAEVNLLDLVHEASQLVLWSSKHSLALSLDPGLQRWVGDPTLLRIALSNLIDNAVKYAKQGQVRIGTALDARGWLQLSVSDQGAGLKPELQSRLFAQFERGHYTDSVSGFGLGLWITRQVARLHGGDVALRTGDGSGCCFVIELPPLALFGEDLVDPPLVA